MQIKRIHHTAVSVADMERSLAFYVDLLGLDLVFDSDIAPNPSLDAVVGMDGATGRVCWVMAGDTMLELWQWDHPRGRPLPDDYRPADRGVTHFALLVDDVQELHRRIVEHGLTANTAPTDLRMHLTTYVRGPDGEIIEILEDRVDDEWQAKLRERAQAKRAAGAASER
jgi:catechol 2,3-dioxygenase-like lactoylglutathione lyase family enzyme